ncbi:RNA recognition motif-containing protein [Haloferula luteola]|uniref:RNA recognition motif-containing protein n=1 Tax=Haloferula luteola TaxID=595692 RepID=A0A840UWT2_9BACT|nr:RNA-binding protein [Haloferula luteola]MBB5350185.1 RNA recognition motif-containing protein [Haloferula luteola]
MKMYVGNLPFTSGDQDLQGLFSEYGTVTDVHMPTDRESGRPRGFAFVTMGSKDEMEAAIKGTDGQDFQGRALRVNEALAREERGGGHGGGQRGGGGNRGGGGRRW